ncbi:MAG: RIP metalloprotease RseP, partial [Candidatus Omnitrophota bacterium]
MSIIIFLFILGLMVVVHEWGHFFAARRIGVKVEKFSFGFGPQVLHRKNKDTEYSINAIPLGGYVKLAGDNLEEYKGKSFEYLSKAPGKRFWVIFCGPLLNYILGILILWVIFFCGYPTLTTVVGSVIDGFGAKEAGLMSGDKILAVDGVRVQYWEELQKIIQGKHEQAVARISFLRDNRPLERDVRIKMRESEDSVGEKRSVGLLGIAPSDKIVRVRHGFWRSFSLGLNKALEITLITYKALWRMLSGKLSMRDSVTGPLGIYFITSKAAQIGLTALLHLIAILSISLGIFNLLPLPILDGGHIVLLAIEKIRGKYLSLKTEQIITRIGMTIIISLALLV